MGINEIQQAESLQIANPVNEELSIILNDGVINSIKISDVTGKVILSDEVNSSTYIKSFKVAKGIYFVEVISGKNNYLKKIVKQ